MIPSEFEYHRPETIDQALVLLTQHGDDAKILAGGHSLLPLMKLRFAEPAHLVDLNFIESLRGIKESNGLIEIAAMTTESELITSPLLLEKCPLIPEAVSQIADPQVRNRGTIGGDIVHADPGNDHPAIMLALEASFVLGFDSDKLNSLKETLNFCNKNNINLVSFHPLLPFPGTELFNKLKKEKRIIINNGNYSFIPKNMSFNQLQNETYKMYKKYYSVSRSEEHTSELQSH